MKKKAVFVLLVLVFTLTLVNSVLANEYCPWCAHYLPTRTPTPCAPLRMPRYETFLPIITLGAYQ